MAELRIAVLASGRGSNLQAILDAIAHGTLPARVVGVFSDRPAAAALERARAAGVPAWAASPREYPTRIAFDRALFDAVDAARPDLVVCAGYMRLLGEAVVTPRAGRLINIHPSLLPAFTGLHTHQRAIDAGCKFAGCTVHGVTAELDVGPILDQAVVPVLPDDTAETLAARVLTQEHIIYPRAVAALLQQR